MKICKTLSYDQATEALRKGFLVRAFNDRNVAMGGVDEVLCGAAGIRAVIHYSEDPSVKFVYEHEVE